MWALRRGVRGAPVLLLALPLLGVARLFPAHGFGLWLRLVAATLVLLLPGSLVARALRLRGASASVAFGLGALARGHFYASSGPEIRRVTVTAEVDGVGLEVETSPCAIIYALGYGSRNQFAADRDAIAGGQMGVTITQASFHVRRPTAAERVKFRPFVRVQCADWQRRSAWSNPIFL